MVGFHSLATGSHRKKTAIVEDRLVTTIRAMMIYIALFHPRLFHARLVIKIRSRKRQMEILVNMRESIKPASAIWSSM